MSIDAETKKDLALDVDEAGNVVGGQSRRMWPRKAKRHVKLSNYIYVTSTASPVESSSSDDCEPDSEMA